MIAIVLLIEFQNYVLLYPPEHLLSNKSSELRKLRIDARTISRFEGARP
jgi:hypothetical protein